MQSNILSVTPLGVFLQRALMWQAINQVLAGVNEMAAQIQTIDFNVFDKACSSRWLLVKSAWMSANEDLRSATHDLIDTSFRWVIVSSTLQGKEL